MALAPSVMALAAALSDDISPPPQLSRDGITLSNGCMELGCASVGVMEDTVVAEEVTGLALNCTAGDAGLHAAAAAGNDDDDDDEGCDVSSKHTRLGRRTDTSPSPLTPTWKNHLSYPQL